MEIREINSVRYYTYPILPDADLREILSTVKKCREDVCYLSPQGDILDLKSEFSLCLSAVLFSGRTKEKGRIGLRDNSDLAYIGMFVNTEG